MTQVGLGTTATNKNLFKVDYEYGELNTDGTTVDTNKNIGMIARATTSIPTTSFVQTFKYDSINRLTEAVEKTGTTQNWIQTFGYDRFGNRTQFTQTIGGTSTPNTNINHPTIDPATNRFTTGQGYVYDFNGNLIHDAEGRSFTFNGDDKQTEVRDTATSSIIGQYFYDGSGARVKKVVPSTGETTIFVYDAGGSLAAEYSTVAPAPEPTTSYLTTDHLGSPRVITDKTGNVISRRDFMPFGEELGVGVGPRTEFLKYSYLGSDRVRQRFTGYEKDDETGLDFAEARMYQNKHGRFTAPDPLLASASATNPQTFNRYIYTGNNPVNYTDPSGLNWCRNSDGTFNFSGRKVACESNQQDFTGQVRQVTQSGCSNGYCNGQGQYILFTEDGRQVRLPSTPEVAAIAQGESVVEATVTVTAEPATDAAASGTLTQSDMAIGTSITQQELLPLPCLGGSDCGDISSQPVDLTIGASTDEMLDTVEILAAGLGQAPVIGEPIDLFVGGGVSLLRGDFEGAGLSALSAIPGPVGNAAGVTKIARKVGKGVDVVNGNSKASRKAQHAYEVFDTATGDVVKTGVSGGPVTKAGKSYRANSQISKWNKSNPGKYDSRIVKTIPPGKNARGKILNWERRNAAKLRKRGQLSDRFFHQRP